MIDIISILKTIFLYVFLPFRIIFIFLLLRFSNSVIHRIRDESSLMSVFLIFGKLIMFTLSLTIDLPKEDYMKYMNYLYSDKKLCCTKNNFNINVWIHR